MRVGLRRRLVVASVSASVVGLAAAGALAVEDKKFKYKLLPGIPATMSTIEETDVSLTLKREINAYGGPVLLDGTFTPELSNAASPRKLVWKLPKGVTIPFFNSSIPELANTTISRMTITLRGTTDCNDPSSDGSYDSSIQPFVGTAAVTYSAIDAATGRPFASRASVRLGPGRDATKTDDVSMSGIVTRGVGLGASFILDGVMRPAAGQDWSACQAGTGTITKMSFATRVDTDGDGVAAPGYYRGGLGMGFGSVSIDEWRVGGMSDQLGPVPEP